MKCSTPPLGALHASVLKEHFEDAPQGTDSTEISKIKTCAHHFLVTKRKLTLFHKPSTFVLSVPRVARGRASRSVLMRGAFCHVWMKLPVQLGAGFMMVPKNLHQKGTASVCLETGATEDDEAAHGEVDKYISDASLCRLVRLLPFLEVSREGTKYACNDFETGIVHPYDKRQQ